MFNILEIPVGRKNCHVLTQPEVLDYVGWLPFRTRKEFDQHLAEHSELELMPLLDNAYRRVGGPSTAPSVLDTTEHVTETGGSDRGGVLQTLHLVWEDGYVFVVGLDRFLFISL